MKKLYLLFLGLAVVASGCIEAGESLETVTGDSKDRIDCGDVEITFEQVSGTTAMIRQMNEGEIGKVTVEWSYSDGSTASETAALKARGRLKIVESGSNGELEKVTVNPERCPETSFSHTP